MKLASNDMHDAQFVSVKTLARHWDCSRTTVSRLLEEAGVQAYYFGGGRNGAERLLTRDVDAFPKSVELPRDLAKTATCSARWRGVRQIAALARNDVRECAR